METELVSQATTEAAQAAQTAATAEAAPGSAPAAPGSAPAAALGPMFSAPTLLGDDEGGFIGLGAEGAGSAIDGSVGKGEKAEEQGGFLASLAEPAASLMSAGGGGWSISTLPGDEGLRWSGVKTEEVFDEWASSGGGRQQARMADLLLQPSPLLATAAIAAAGGKAGESSSNLTLVAGLAKSDTEEGWKDFVGPPPPNHCSGKAGSDTISRACFPETADKGVFSCFPFLICDEVFVCCSLSTSSMPRHSQIPGTEYELP